MVHLFSIVLLKSIVGHENWYFIDSAFNPANILSSSALLSNLNDNDLCYSEPRKVFYSDTPPTRPNGIFCKDESFTVLNMNTLSTKKEKLVNLNSIIDVKRFSSHLKQLRVTSYVMRFINNLQNKLKNKSLSLRLVNSDELKKADFLLVKTD